MMTEALMNRRQLLQLMSLIRSAFIHSSIRSVIVLNIQDQTCAREAVRKDGTLAPNTITTKEGSLRLPAPD